MNETLSQEEISANDQLNPDQFHAVIVDESQSVEERANDLADKKFNETVARETVAPLELPEGGVSRLAARAWGIARNTAGFAGQIVKNPRESAKRLWVQTFDVHYKDRYRREAKKNIVDEANYFQGEENSEEIMSGLQETVIERFSHRDADKLVSEDAGERIEHLDDIDSDASRDIHRRVTSLTESFAIGDLTEDNFDESAKRLINDLSEEYPELVGKGLLYADNLLKVARNVRTAISHLEGEARLDKLDEVLGLVKVTVGEASLGARTEIEYSKTEQFVQAIERSKTGKIAASASIIATTAAIGKVLAQKTAAKAAGITAGFMGAGGLIAGKKRATEIKEDRFRHSRDRAVGQEFDDTARRRGLMEKVRYETVSANDLSESIQEFFVADVKDFGPDKLREINNLSQEDVMKLALLLASVKARNDMSNSEGIDLIHYSEVSSVEQERFDLLSTEIYATAALRQLIEDKGIEWLSEEINLTDEIHDYDQLAKMLYSVAEADLGVDISEKDAAYKDLRRKEIFKAAVTGAIVGGVLGASVQEAMAYVPVIGASVDGLFETGKAGHNQTLLAGIFNREQPSGFTGNLTDVGGDVKFADVDGFTTKQSSDGSWLVEQDSTGKTVNIEYDDSGLLSKGSAADLKELGFNIHDKIDTPNLSGELKEFSVGENKFVFPKEYKIEQNSTGQWNIIDNEGHTVHSIELNPDGSLSDASIADLETGGISVSEDIQLVETTVDVPGQGVNDIVNNHINETKKVNRVLWYGNDTPSPDFDLNELRTHAGGVDGSWFDQDGNVVIDITAMTPEGSFWGNQSANSDSLTSAGRLSLAVSASKDTQSTVFDFSFNTTPDGRTIATIPPGDPIHQMFQMDGEKRVFTGSYFEIMENTGVIDAKGEQVKILGTYVGQDNASNLTDRIVTTKQAYTTSLEIPPAPEHIQIVSYEPDSLVEPAPFVPVHLRKGLETEKKNRQRLYYEYGGSVYEEDGQEVDDLINSTIPELIDDPDARISSGNATQWYNGVVRRNRGDEYVDDILETVESSPGLKSIDNNTRAIVAIPVAGIKEGENIFETLSLYGQQPEEDVTGTRVLLHVNWRAEDISGSGQQEKLEHTLAEIERAKITYPGLDITVIQTEWEAGETDNGVIGHAVRKLYDTAILATGKAIEDGQMDPDHEVVIIRNDSDAKGMSKGYIGRMVDAVTADRTDAAAGRIKWGIEQSRDLPGLALTMQVYEGIRGSAERAKAKGIRSSIETIGINTGVRLSTLAAVGSIGFSDYTGAGSDDLTVGGRIKALRNKDSHVRHKIYNSRNRGIRNRLRRRSSIGYIPNSTSSTNDDYVVIANGSTIDSDISRLEGEYRSGSPVVKAWDRFDQGGHRDRSAGLGDDKSKEDPRKDIDIIAERVQSQVNSMINGWGVDPLHAEMEFRRSFPNNKPGEDPMYTFETDASGKMVFKFTESGKGLLKRRITHQGLTGQFDPLGSRRMRVNYGIGTARRQFANGLDRTPRLVKGVS